MNTTMGYLNTKRQGLKSTKKKTPDTYLEDNYNVNVFFCDTVDPSTTQDGNIYSDLCIRFPIMFNIGNIYIYIVCMCDYNAIL